MALQPFDFSSRAMSLFDNDPFFSSAFGGSMFGHHGGVSARDRSRAHLQQHNQLSQNFSPFGLFDQMNNMMNQMTQQMFASANRMMMMGDEDMNAPANGGVYMARAVYTSDGRDSFYETKQRFVDGQGNDRSALERGMNDKAKRVTREKLRNGDSTIREEFNNVPEEEKASFDDNWHSTLRSKAQELRGISQSSSTGAGRRSITGSRQQSDMLPLEYRSAARRHSSSSLSDSPVLPSSPIIEDVTDQYDERAYNTSTNAHDPYYDSIPERSSIRNDRRISSVKPSRISSPPPPPSSSSSSSRRFSKPLAQSTRTATQSYPRVITVEDDDDDLLDRSRRHSSDRATPTVNKSRRTSTNKQPTSRRAHNY